MSSLFLVLGAVCFSLVLLLLSPLDDLLAWCHLIKSDTKIASMSSDIPTREETFSMNSKKSNGRKRFKLKIDYYLYDGNDDNKDLAKVLKLAKDGNYDQIDTFVPVDLLNKTTIYNVVDKLETEHGIENNIWSGYSDAEDIEINFFEHYTLLVKPDEEYKILLGFPKSKESIIKQACDSISERIYEESKSDLVFTTADTETLAPYYAKTYLLREQKGLSNKLEDVFAKSDKKTAAIEQEIFSIVSVLKQKNQAQEKFSAREQELKEMTWDQVSDLSDSLPSVEDYATGKTKMPF
jgi:hypothetical protein